MITEIIVFRPKENFRTVVTYFNVSKAREIIDYRGIPVIEVTHGNEVSRHRISQDLTWKNIQENKMDSTHSHLQDELNKMFETYISEQGIFKEDKENGEPHPGMVAIGTEPNDDRDVGDKFQAISEKFFKQLRDFDTSIGKHLLVKQAPIVDVIQFEEGDNSKVHVNIRATLDYFKTADELADAKGESK